MDAGVGAARAGGAGTAGARMALALALVVAVALVAAVAPATGCRRGAPSDAASPRGAPPGDTAPPGGAPDPGVPVSPGPAAPDGVTCPLDGVTAAPVSLLRRPLAVAVDNHPGARPQSGLEAACLVYELPVEGGLTRFLAFFLHADAAAVGPVRSARDYMLPLAQERAAVLCHAGGSPQAYAALARVNMPDLDDMFGGGAYWRIKARASPHNLYTSTFALQGKALARGWGAAAALAPGGFAFSPPDATGGAAPGAANVAGAPAAHAWLRPGGALGERVDWRYNDDAGAYLRFSGGVPHCTALDGSQLLAKNVLILYTDVTPVPGDREGRLNVRTAGEGRALLLNRGRMREGRWLKLTPAAPTTLVALEGDDLKLEPGATWVVLVARNTIVEWE